MRDDPMLFSSKSFLLENDSQARSWVLSKFEERVDSCSWNAQEMVE